MRLKDAIKQASQNGFTLRHIDGEYIITRKGEPHDSNRAYFTNELDDAVETCDMAWRYAKVSA